MAARRCRQVEAAQSCSQAPFVEKVELQRIIPMKTLNSALYPVFKWRISRQGKL